MAKILKSEAVDSLVGTMPLSLADVEREAAAIIQSAQTKAREILQSALTEGEHRKQAAFAAGMEEGKRQGLEVGCKEGLLSAQKEAQSKLAAAADSLLKLLAEMVKTFEAKLKFAEKSAKLDLVRLAIRIAESIIKKEVRLDTGILRANVEKAVGLIGKKHAVTVCVNPADLAAAEQLLPAMRQILAGIETVKIEGDPVVAAGGCVVRSENGAVDADVKTQLQEIEQILTS
jgi:flagellar assembly protein FliH